MLWPVRGFRPVRAGPLFIENVPNPVRATESPLASASWIASNTPFTAAASAFDSEARLATRDTMSDLFNSPSSSTGIDHFRAPGIRATLPTRAPTFDSSLEPVHPTMGQSSEPSDVSAPAHILPAPSRRLASRRSFAVVSPDARPSAGRRQRSAGRHLRSRLTTATP